jgi:hypothetical protein
LNVSNSSVGEVEVVEEGLRKTAALLFVLTVAQPCFAACVVVCPAGQERVDGVCITPEEPTVPEEPTGACVNTAEVECGFNISKAEWAAESINYTTVVIPRGKTLVSAINTTDRGSDAYGSIGFAPPFANRNGVLDIWISATPNGPELDTGDCGKEDVSAFFNIDWTATAYQNDCVLTGGQRYFFNMRHINPDEEWSNSQRFVYN